MYPVVVLGYPDLFVFSFFSLKFMLVDVILAACTKCGRPTFSSCRVWRGYDQLRYLSISKMAIY